MLIINYNLNDFPYVAVISNTKLGSLLQLIILWNYKDIKNFSDFVIF